MADLREARRKLEEIRRQQAEAAAEVMRLEVAPKWETVSEILLENDSVCEKISSLKNREEYKIFAEKLVSVFDDVYENAVPEIEESRAKKKERSERRKARQQKKDESDFDDFYNGNSISVISNPDDDDIPEEKEEEVEMVIDPEYGMRVPRKGMFKTTDPETGGELIFLNGRAVH